MRKRSRIRIGNQTAFSSLSLIDPFKYAVANGFDAFEWFFDEKDSGRGCEKSSMTPEVRTLIKECSNDNDISLSVHTRWQADLSKTGLSEEILGDIQFATDVGAFLFVIHLCADGGLKSYAEAIMPLSDMLVEAGMMLAVENTPANTPQDFNELFELLHRADRPSNIGMCLDLGHANLCADTRNDYIKFIDLLDAAVPVVHIHLHENYGDYDSHLPLFSGPSGKDPSGIKRFIEWLTMRNFSGCIILEQWPDTPDILKDARSRLLAMIYESDLSKPSCRRVGTKELENYSVIPRLDRGIHPSTGSG
ncbi:MAG: TIM barrel protein [Nitrospirota bacterium]